MYFHYPRAVLGRGDEGWTLRGISLEVHRGLDARHRRRVGLGEVDVDPGDVRAAPSPARDACGSTAVTSASSAGDDANELRRRNQIVFQNPRRSLDPRMTIRRSLSEPMRALQGRTTRRRRAGRRARAGGSRPRGAPRFPHQLSGGQLQRVGIARSLSVDPTVLYADEPVSALDVSVQAQVLNLLMDLRDELGLTLVMVSHDLGVVSRMCEEIIVMRDGRIVEAGRTDAVLTHPESAVHRSTPQCRSARQPRVRSGVSSMTTTLAREGAASPWSIGS